MIGMKKIIGTIAFLMLMSVLAVPMAVSAAVAHEVTATPSSVLWEQAVAISFVANSGVGGGWWNGTAYCNLTDPNGDIVRLGGKAVNLANANANKYANWSYDPHDSGVWTVTIDMVRTSGTITIADHTTTFKVERSGQWLNRVVQNWSVLVYFLFVIVAVLAVMLLLMSRFNKEVE